MTALQNLLNSTMLLHIIGVSALTVLMCTGVLTAEVGLPLLTGLVGLGVGTTVTTNSPSEQPTKLSTVDKPVA